MHTNQETVTARPKRRFMFGALALAITCSMVGYAIGQEQAKQPPKHPIVFWEIASNDAEKSTAFLNEVFGWEDVTTPNTAIHFYGTQDDSTGPLQGGVFTLRKAKLPFLTLFIAVDDLDAMVKKVEAAGGHIVLPPETPVPGGSRICLFNEPSGVTLAMIERRKTAPAATSETE